jgi:hypothetical protein
MPEGDLSELIDIAAAYLTQGSEGSLDDPLSHRAHRERVRVRASPVEVIPLLSIGS